MKNNLRTWQVVTMIGMMTFLPGLTFAQTEVYGTNIAVNSFSVADSIHRPSSFIHRLETEVRPGYILPTNNYLRGDNEWQQPIRNSFSAHLKYAFQYAPGTCMDRIYGGAYQGLGLAWYTFGEHKHIGDPIALYLLQGARIARFSPQVSLNYEWNFGVSFGWEPHDYDYNSYNRMIGSKTNAYLNTNLYLNWMLSPQFDLTTGVALTHFSNGNTKFPNAGLNTIGLKIGLVYNFHRDEHVHSKPVYQPLPEFPRHISYDLVLFGSWRRKGIIDGDEQIASPDAYPVLGFNFAPMYNVGYKFRTGISLDGIYDGSANIYIPPYIVGTDPPFMKPSVNKQLALGLSARFEYVMPYFTVGLGMGANVLHSGGDLKGFYQILALKIALSRSSFLHIGYNLQNFHTPNFLMLGVGFRFHNLYPRLQR